MTKIENRYIIRRKRANMGFLIAGSVIMLFGILVGVAIGRPAKVDDNG